jgi:hypothetical protein
LILSAELKSDGMAMVIRFMPMALAQAAVRKVDPNIIKRANINVMALFFCIEGLRLDDVISSF